MENKRHPSGVNQYLLKRNTQLRATIDELLEINIHNAKLLSQFNTIGRITKDIVAKDFLTTASIALTGVTYQMDLCLSDEGRKPMVVSENRAYILSWDDIVKLAVFAGLFSEVHA